MNKLIICMTIMHTGTHSVLNLLVSTNEISIMKSDYSYCGLLNRYLYDKITLNEFKNELFVGAKTRIIPHFHICFLHHHYLYYQEREGEFNTKTSEVSCWVDWTKVMDKGIDAIKISSMRDPLLTVCTVLLRGGVHNSYEGLNLSQQMQMIEDNHSYLLKHSRDNAVLIPFDLMGRWSPQEREDKVIEAFDFLEIKYTNAANAEIQKCYQHNSTTEARAHELSLLDKETFDEIFYCREILKAGQNPKGKSKILDTEIERYKGRKDLADFYKSQGYENLAWF